MLQLLVKNLLARHLKSKYGIDVDNLESDDSNQDEEYAKFVSDVQRTVKNWKEARPKRRTSKYKRLSNTRKVSENDMLLFIFD